MNTFRTYHPREREQGFTIVEVLISLTIFSIAVAGVITVAAQGGLSVNTAKDKLTASYLADEGVELMRALRDTGVVSLPVGSETEGWNNFLSTTAGCASDAPCDIDGTNGSGGSTPGPFPTAANLFTCPIAGCPLYYDPGTGYYGHTWTGGGTPPFPRFYRKSTVSGTGDEATITVTVTWKEGVATQSLTETENVFNWYNP